MDPPSDLPGLILMPLKLALPVADGTERRDRESGKARTGDQKGSGACLGLNRPARFSWSSTSALLDLFLPLFTLPPLASGVGTPRGSKGVRNVALQSGAKRGAFRVRGGTLHFGGG